MPWPFSSESSTSTGHPEPADGPGLLSRMWGDMQQAAHEYNLVARSAESLERQTKDIETNGIVQQGVLRTFTNRIYGVMHITEIVEKSFSGMGWAFYFATCPDLRTHVREASTDWGYDHLSLRGLLVGASTALTTTPSTINRFERAANERVNTQLHMMGISTGLSAGISYILKKVGQQSTSEFRKLMFHRVRRGWQGLGVLALMYGFGQIHDALENSRSFTKHLKPFRNRYLDSRTRQMNEGFNELCGEIGPEFFNPWY